MSKKIRLHDNWLFSKQAVGTTLEQIHQDSVAWSCIDLPHDWLIYQTKDLYETSEGWYQRILKKSSLEDDVCYSLCFDGVYMNSSLFINDILVGDWKYGYSSFEFDITNFLTKDENEILVRVVHESPNSRWYSGAGIYRNVYLKSYPKVHLSSNGIYIHPNFQDGAWSIDITTEINTHCYDVRKTLAYHSEHLPSIAQEVPFSSENYTIRQIVMSGQEGLDAKICTTQSIDCSLCTEHDSFSQHIAISNPVIWDINSPFCYQLKTELLHNDTVIDTEIQAFGFRTMEFTADHGFFLNGRHVKLNGTCEHHDLGCLGAVMNRHALKRRLILLKKMGVNAIRTSHNMPAPELLELADELGLLILSESFDMWRHSKTTYDYARFFDDWSALDVESWIRQDRNHPCILMWSIGNEIHDTHVNEAGQETAKYLIDLVRQYDPLKNAPITIGSNYMPWNNAQQCAKLIDVVGYNYGEAYYQNHHKSYPNWCIYGSETSSTVQSRGVYHFPYAQSVLADDDEQCSSLGNCSTSWGAKNSEFCIITERDSEFSAGQFLWTGFDYIGEPTPYHTKNSYFGQIDTAGFPKDSYFIYQAEWTDYKEAPMVHIFPYWDFSIGQLIDVRVCSNAPIVELFLNDVSLGRHTIDHLHGSVLTANWIIPYEKGIVKAIAYDELDQVIAQDVLSSFEDAAQIILEPDQTTLHANGDDLIYVNISMKDKNGVPVANANNRVEISVTGNGRLIGLDNGDSTDYDEYKGSSRRLFNGHLLAVIGAKTTAGPIKITASSVGLPDALMELTAVSDTPEPGISATMENAKSSPSNEIPVRKIELISSNGTHLNTMVPSTTITAVTYPSNNSYPDLIWRITDTSGINTKIASLTVSGNTAVVNAFGDGHAIVRCCTTNGDNKIHLISLYDIMIDGFGELAINPYDFVSSGLYTRSNIPLTNGNERGIATSRDKDSRITFDHLDFGELGSDEITLPIFCLDSDPLDFEIYQGVLGEPDAELLLNARYHKTSIWNTYQEETYQLNRKLTGMTTLSFVFHRKVHLKGFLFKKPEKAYEKLLAGKCDFVCGDWFNKQDFSILDIGNNVTIEFHDMDFGEIGSTRLTICGKSHIPCNTIQIRFHGSSGSMIHMVEFTKTDLECEKTFSIPRITGLQSVSFVFLPGCNFDMHWIQFHKTNN